MTTKARLLIICFLMLLCIGTVSANGDTNGTDVQSNESPTLETSDIDMRYRDGTSFDVHLLNGEKNVSNKTVDITINKKTYSLKTNASGMVSLKINLNPGVYDFKTCCILDNHKLSALNKVKVSQMSTKLIAEKSIDLPYKEGKYSVSLADGDNRKLTGKTVTITVLGKSYNAVTNKNGVASLPINLDKRSYQISAKFVENGYSSSSVTSTINVKVLNTRIISSPATFTGKNQSYTFRVVDQNSRPVQNHQGCCDIGKYSYNFKTDADGFVTLNMTLPMGIYQATISSYFSSGYTHSITKNRITVNCNDYIIIAQDFETVVDSGVFYYVSVKDKNNTPPNLNLKTNIYKDGKYLKTIGTRIHEDGLACISLDLNPGTYLFRNYVTLDAGYSTYNDSTIIIKPAHVIVESSNLKLNRKGEYFTVTFKNNETGGGIANHQVHFKIKGVTYKTLTNEKGEAKLQINLENGNYPISYHFDGNSKYGDVDGNNTIWKWQYILETTLTPLNDEIFRKGTYYQVALKDSNGIPLKGQPVYITVKGVSYKCTTDSEGIAKLKINLWDGIYSIKAEFKDSKDFKRSAISTSLSVNTTPNFNYTLSFSRHTESNGLKCTNIREFDVTYGDKHYKLCSDDIRKGFTEVTVKKPYLVTGDGLESNYKIKQGMEFRIVGDNLQMVFYGRTPAISQFSVIYDCKNGAHKLQFVIDNEVVATLAMTIYFPEDEFMRLVKSGFYYMGNEFVDSSFKCQGHEMKRVFQFSEGNELLVEGVEQSDNFKAIQTYLVDYKKIPESFTEKELGKAEPFNGKYDQYAYELYLAALSLLVNSDSLCDNLAEMHNVTWDKKFQLVLVTLDWSGLSIDSHVPLIVNGERNDTFKFRAMHGLLFSYLEEMALKATGNDAKSTLTNVVDALCGGEDFVVDVINNTLTLSLFNDRDKIILDLETGVVVTQTGSDFINHLFLKGSYSNFKILPTNPNTFQYVMMNVKHHLNNLNDLFSSVTARKLLISGDRFIEEAASVVVGFALGFPAPFNIFLATVYFGEFTIKYRNNFAPLNTYQYFSLHGNVRDMRTIQMRNPETNYMDSIEIPLDIDGNRIMDKAIYIDSLTGAHNLTAKEKVMVEEYIKQKQKEGFSWF